MQLLTIAKFLSCSADTCSASDFVYLDFQNVLYRLDNSAKGSCFLSLSSDNELVLIAFFKQLVMTFHTLPSFEDFGQLGALMPDRAKRIVLVSFVVT